MFKTKKQENNEQTIQLDNIDSNSERTVPVTVDSEAMKNQDLESQNQTDSTSVTFKNADELAKKLADAHDHRLSKSKVIIVLMAMSLSSAMAFIDINGLSIVLPYVATDINAELTITWANTSQLISMAIFQLLCGRFADMFGRKNLMVGSIVLLAFFQLACGFAQNEVQFFIFRAICGMCDGNIQSLTMTVMSDIVPLEERGKYQGYVTASMGIGNGGGPFIGALFIRHSTWRKYFYTLFSISLSSSLIIGFLVPNTQARVGLKQKLLSIDYTGFFFGAMSIILILIPINGGGLQFAWNSPRVISMLAIGGGCFLTFIIVETKIAKLPLIPLSFFTDSVSLCFIFVQSILFGLAFFSLFFYYGYYFEVVRGLTAIKTACFILCIVVPQAITSAVAGRFTTWSKHYNPTIWCGFTLWTLSLSLLAGYVGEKTSLVGVAFIMVINGIGQGMSFQTTMIAALAHTRQQDRAVVISTRQVLRYFGGSIGLALSTLIFSSTYVGYLKTDSFINLTENAVLKAYLRNHVYSKIDLSGTEWSDEQVRYIRALYMKCLRWVFTFWAPLIGSCLFLSLFVKDTGLVYKDDRERAEKERLEMEQEKEQEQETKN